MIKLKTFSDFITSKRLGFVLSCQLEFLAASLSDMKNIFLVLSISFIFSQLTASSIHQCDFTGKIEKLESGSSTSSDVNIQFSRRTFKTWMFGGSACKNAVGMTFATTIPTSDEYLKELSPGASLDITAYMICPEQAPGCFWSWHSYKLIEQ